MKVAVSPAAAARRRIVSLAATRASASASGVERTEVELELAGAAFVVARWRSACRLLQLVGRGLDHGQPAPGAVVEVAGLVDGLAVAVEQVELELGRRGERLGQLAGGLDGLHEGRCGDHPATATRSGVSTVHTTRPSPSPWSMSVLASARRRMSDSR